MKIQYSKDAAKYISKQDKPTKIRLKSAIDGLIETPPKGDVKLLQGGGNELRLRVGKFRIIFEYITQNEIKLLMINKIDSRGDVYK